MAGIKEIVSANPDILFGTPVFAGTRVPVKSLFWHLEKGITLDEFLEDFPSVKREQAVGLLQLMENIFSKEDYISIYEAVA